MVPYRRRLTCVHMGVGVGLLIVMTDLVTTPRDLLRLTYLDLLRLTGLSLPRQKMTYQCISYSLSI